MVPEISTILSGQNDLPDPQKLHIMFRINETPSAS